MKNPTLKIILFAAICLLVLRCVQECNNQKPQPTPLNTDSLQFIIKAQDYQYGILSVQYNNEHESRLKSEAALKERKVVYKQRVDTIFKTAPDTCEPYLNAMRAECDTLLAAADTNIARLIKEAETLRNALINRNERIGMDSIVMVGKDAMLDKLTEVIAELEKKSKRQRWIGRFEGAAVTQLLNSVKNNLIKD